MPTTFNVPKSPAKSVLTIENFQGVDFTNSPANIDNSKSPNAVNMIRDVPGKVRKCMGYKTIKTYLDENDEPLPINGFHYLRGDREGFIHAGTSIFWDKIWLYDAANDQRSKAWQFEDKLYFLDGKELLMFYSTKESSASGHTTGYHAKEVSGKTFSETVTLKTDDYVNFYLPYECDTVVVEYNGQSEEVTLEDPSTYLFENSYGNYEFTFTFYATLEGETVTLEGKTDVGVLGLDTDCTFSADGGPLESVDISYTVGAKEYNIHIDPESPDSCEWTNDIGEHNYSFDVAWGYYEEDHVGTSEITSSTEIVQDLSDVDLIEGFDFTFTSDTSFRFNITIGFSGSGYYSDRYWSGGPLRTVTVSYPENIPEGVTRVYLKSVKLTASYPRYATVEATGPHKVITDIGAEATIINTEPLKGTLEYVINQELTNGYIDDREGGYIDEDGNSHHVERVADNAYIPVLTIGKSPSGGGEPYEDLNLITPAFTELFKGETGIKDFQLSFTDLDDTPPLAWILNSSGEWVEKTYGTDYTYSASTGVVTFTTAPGLPPVGGEDNVKITAYRTIDGYADQINKCTIGILYGVNGATDRLFVSGNPEKINQDWYSGFNDPTYFPDTGYSVLGTASSAIVGYSIISNYLAAHKDYMEKDQNIILRQGDYIENEPSFRIINTLQGAGAVAPFSFAYLSTEPLFLTKQGIFAVTAQDITGEKYAQNRSFFINGKLLEEANLDKAFGFVYKDMYWLCLNGVAYILDGLQPLQTDRSMPYATRQYAGFYRTNLPANVMWEKDDICYFGTPDGRVCEFYTDKYALESYNDDGEPIEAIWETPDIDGKLFYKNKTLRYVALRLDSALSTSVNIFVMNRGLWQFIKKDDTSGRYFSFANLVFSKMSFSGDKTQHTISTKVRVKKVDKFRLRLVNDDANEPFGLYNIAFEYVENGNYKG